jgi:hypothetical protein
MVFSCVVLVAGLGIFPVAQAADHSFVADASLCSLETTGIAPLALEEQAESLKCGKDVSCKSPVCAVDCCNPCPSVYGFAEALFLERGNQSFNQPVVITGAWPDNFDTVLSTGDLDFDWEPGVRALAGIRLNECTGWGVEASYLGLFEANAAATAVRPGEDTGLSFPGGLGPATNVFSNADSIRLDYDSQLHTGDLSLVHCRASCDQRRSTELMIGFRYVDLQETFGISGVRLIEGLPETGVYNLWTDNNLYGAQIGARLRRCRGRLSGEVTGKAGIYYNDASQSQYIVDYPGVVLRNAGAEDDNVAFMGEVNVSGIYRLTDVWGLRAGYNLIWIEGVALAPDQLDFSAQIPGGDQLSSSGGLFLHGVNFGLEARW